MYVLMVLKTSLRLTRVPASFNSLNVIILLNLLLQFLVSFIYHEVSFLAVIKKELPLFSGVSIPLLHCNGVILARGMVMIKISGGGGW